MKKEMAVFFASLGFYRLSVRRRKVLSIVFLGSLVLHVLGLLVFGGVAIMRSLREEKTVFVTPPPIKSYDPRKLEHKVKVHKRQRSSSRPSMMPRMVSMKTSDLALPEIKMDTRVIRASFRSKFRAVSRGSLGAGTSDGWGLDGFGRDGYSSVNFFGIPVRGSKIAILVDVSVSMVEEQRGGPRGFMRVKNRLNKVINMLNEETLFNVMVFADAASAFSKKKMVIASDQNKGDAKLYLRPFNTAGNWGLSQGNITASSKGVPALGGTTRLDLALTAAFQNGADTILIISDGLPRVLKGYTRSQMTARMAEQRAWQERNAGAIQAWQAAEAAAPVATEKIWVPAQPARPEQVIPARAPSKKPPKEGQKPDMGSPRRVIPAQPARPGYWKTVTRRRGGGGGRRPKPPPPPQEKYWTLTDFVQHLTMLYKDLYEKKGKKQPTIHAIGYQIDKEGGDFLTGLTKHYRGKYQRVARID